MNLSRLHKTFANFLKAGPGNLFLLLQQGGFNPPVGAILLVKDLPTVGSYVNSSQEGKIHDDTVTNTCDFSKPILTPAVVELR